MSSPQVQTTSNLRHQTRLACGLIPLFNMLREHDIDPQDILATAKIRTVEFLDPAFTITLEQELTIIEKALEVLPQETPSLELAKHYHLHNFSVLGLAIRSCSNLGEVFELIRSYPRLQWGICESAAKFEGATLTFELIAGQTKVERFLLERDMACFKTLFSEAIGEELTIVEACFSIPTPSNLEVYRSFFNCPIKFNQTISSLTINLGTLEKKVPSADPLSKAFYEAQCARLSAEIDEPFLYSTLIRDQLSQATPIPALETLAADINIELRTLQRLLKKEGENFSSILKEVRLKRAKDRLNFSTLSIEQIALELGFNDAVAFSHAFKQWTGESPRQWRNK